MKKLIFIITLGVCLNASGQDKVGYNLEYDEPENVSNLFVCIDLPIGYDFNNVQDFDIMAEEVFISTYGTDSILLLRIGVQYIIWINWPVEIPIHQKYLCSTILS